MPNSSLTPFDGLTPERLLTALESVGLEPDGRLLALNSFENRVYQVSCYDSVPRVVKFYRPGRWPDAAILEEHAFVAELAEAEIPAVAPQVIGGATLHHYEEFRFAVYPRQGGRAPELDRSDTLQWMGRLLGRIHQVGARQPFEHRPRLDLASFGTASRDFLWSAGILPIDLAATYFGVVDQVLAGVSRAFERAGRFAALRLHGDCHAGNVLWTDAGPHFVDFDDARQGPAIQDLWMLLSGDREAMSLQLADVLAGYELFREFDTRELHLIEALRSLRLLHYSAWIARRWNDPAFPRAFPWFGTTRYWQDRILELREQVAAMDEPPLWPA